ncbi:hypothetical protein [Streptomyces sp. NPDC003032]
MDTGIWDALPPVTRERVDELVVAGRRVWAVKEIWQAFDGEGFAEPRPGLNACQDVVAARHEVLADRIARPARPTVTDLADRVSAEPGRPVVIEAVWDGDSSGWMVDLVAVFPGTADAADPHRELRLTTFREGSDLRIFNGQVPPWPEAEEARRAGEALAEMFGVRFHFASPDEPDDQAPRWWDTH